MTIAAPVPCTARAKISVPTLGARAAPTDATVKTPKPTQNIRRLPNRSPRAAPVSNEHANARLYAFTVHSRSDRLPCNDALMDGSAVVTTNVSNAVMKTPRDRTRAGSSDVEETSFTQTASYLRRTRCAGNWRTSCQERTTSASGAETYEVSRTRHRPRCRALALVSSTSMCRGWYRRI